MKPQRGWDTPASPTEAQAHGSADELTRYYVSVREQSAQLCEPLEIEDFGVQPMADASPPKWHLAHTTWFFETFILREFVPGYAVFHPKFEYLFNSYYNGVGEPYPRPRRGHLSRPTVAEVMAYREHVDQHMQELLDSADAEDVQARTVLGLHHEQQHQELLLTDLKYNFGNNPLYPAYGGSCADARESPAALTFTTFDGGIVAVGHNTADGFAFDNELPRHEVLLQPFLLADRLVTNSEFLDFVDDGGYERADLWLSEGWSTVQAAGWQAPLYWVHEDGQWCEYRLDGLHPLQGNLPVVHVSAHEAFAYATWAGLRLPTEFEWEHASNVAVEPGSFVEDGVYHPQAARGSGLGQMFGDVWEWTSSSYGPYPGYAPLPGTLGEYNGKFMSSQLVLRGGSTATPGSHIRASYRNFFYPPDRWQFSGIRLAKHIE